MGFDLGKAASSGDGCEGLRKVLELEAGSGLAQIQIKAGRRPLGSAGVLQECLSFQSTFPDPNGAAGISLGCPQQHPGCAARSSQHSL